MREHHCATPEGRRIRVADMTTAEIEEVLCDGFVIVSPQEPGDPFRGDLRQLVLDRLRLELEIRAMGLAWPGGADA